MTPSRPLALAAASGVLLAGLGVAAPASADTPGCVSGREYDKIPTDLSMSLKRTHAIFDTKGRQDGGGLDTQIRTYRGCSDAEGERSVLVTFQRVDGVYRVADKQRTVS